MVERLVYLQLLTAAIAGMMFQAILGLDLLQKRLVRYNNFHYISEDCVADFRFSLSEPKGFSSNFFKALQSREKTNATACVNAKPNLQQVRKLGDKKQSVTFFQTFITKFRRQTAISARCFPEIAMTASLDGKTS